MCHLGHEDGCLLRANQFDHELAAGNGGSGDISNVCKNMLHPGYAAPASETSHVPAELVRNFFCVLRGTQRTLTGRPTAGAQVLARVPKVPWHPYHSGPALHCRVPCSPCVLAFL